jgi:uncharacterized membrane protein SpoIIM required for sporulation
VNALSAAASYAFRAAREDEWRRLDTLVTRAERKSPRALSDEDLMALPILYRGALSSLSVARETSLDLELITYLEGLCARAYFFIYGVRTSPWRRLGAFFRHDWPTAVRSLWRETIVAALLLLAGVLAGYLLVSRDPSWFGSFVPGDLSGGRDFSSTREHLSSTLYDNGEKGMLGIFATFLFTHNSQVSILCFTLGFAFGVPTALLLVSNGATAGAFYALFASRGLGFELGGWLLIHGVTEMFAIILAGAAGLKIGWAVVFPGDASRMTAASEAGRTAALVMAGVVVMLFVAGLLEGVGRQRITSDGARYAIAAGSLLLWTGFYYLPRRRRDG